MFFFITIQSGKELSSHPVRFIDFRRQYWKQFGDKFGSLYHWKPIFNIEFLTNRKTFVYDYSLLIIGFESYHWVEKRHELLKTNHPIAIYIRVLTGQIILNWNVRPLSLYVKPVMADHPSAINILLIFLFIKLPDYFYHKKGWLNAKSANVAKHWSFPLPYGKNIFIQRIFLLHYVLRFC